MEQIPNVLKLAGESYLGALTGRTQQQDFIHPYSFVPEEIGRVGAQHDLPSSSPLDPGEHLRQEANDFRVE